MDRRNVDSSFFQSKIATIKDTREYFYLLICFKDILSTYYLTHQYMTILILIEKPIISAK